MNKERIKHGKFSTPLRYIALASEWLRDYLKGSCVILDSSCGDGRFFALSWEFPESRYIGFDVDEAQIQSNIEKYPFITFQARNSLDKISRQSYGIDEDECLCVVGNPPYNDATSIVRRGIKEKGGVADVDIRRRDIGLSFLNSYVKLGADFVLVLHPLSYIIKKANRQSAAPFFNNYHLEKHVIFSSHVFEGTAQSNPFPIIMALYKRDTMGLGDVGTIVFQTEEGCSFSLSGWSYIGSYCSKYPVRACYEPEILFWTMRDINALKRNKTFTAHRSTSTIDVDPDKLPYYCYADLFKRYAEVPYWMGNFDIPLPKNGLSEEEKQLVCKVSKFNNPAIFGETEQPTDDEIKRVFHLVNSVCRVE